MFKTIGFMLLLSTIGCAIKPSKRMGVDKKFVRDTITIKMDGENRQVYVLDSTSMEDLDSLSSVSYFGTESGRHIFFQWSKVAYPPNDILLFALDTTFCRLETTFPVWKEKEKIYPSNRERLHDLHVSFKHKTCSDNEELQHPSAL